MAERCMNCKKRIWEPWAGEEHMFCCQDCEEQWAYYNCDVVGTQYPGNAEEVLKRPDREDLEP